MSFKALLKCGQHQLFVAVVYHESRAYIAQLVEVTDSDSAVGRGDG